MPNYNKIKGTNFESRFIKKLLATKQAIKAGRFYASKGVTDVWWVDMDGVHNEAQLKYSSKNNPYISKKEMENLKQFSRNTMGLIKVWLVKKQAYKKTVMEVVV